LEGTRAKISVDSGKRWSDTLRCPHGRGGRLPYSRWKANETTGGGPFKPELPPFPLNRERSPVVRVRPTLLLPHL
jgi:hypothetical protein